MHWFNTLFIPPSSLLLQWQAVTLPQLVCFKTRSGTINVLEQIGTKYRELGVLLLKDTTGSITKAIIENNKYDATNIIFDIFQKWIEGKGTLPVEWGTLAEVLKNIGLTKLAYEIAYRNSWSFILSVISISNSFHAAWHPLIYWYMLYVLCCYL